MRNTLIKYYVLFVMLIAGQSLFAQNTQILEAKLSTRRAIVYQNETIRLTLDIRSTGVSIGQNLQLRNMPPNSQLVQIGAFKEHAATKKETNGIIVETRKFTGKFRPLTPGTIILQPHINLTVLTKKRSFFGTVMHHSPHTLQVKPLTLSVRSIPASKRPSEYENAVGNFTFDVKVEPSDVAVGDLINISTLIKGDGYLDEVSPIGILSNQLFKVYDPKPLKQNPAMRSFVQTVVVLSTNATEIPTLSFSYFDPETSEYKVAVKGPFPLSFHPEKHITIDQFNPESASNKKQTDSKTAIGEISGTVKTRITSTLKSGTTTGTLTDEEPIRFAPSYSALITVEPPLGSQVTILDSYQEWHKIEYKNNRGWLPRTALSEKSE